MMTTKPLCTRRECNDEAVATTGDGDPVCSDHLQDWQDEQLLFPRSDEAAARREAFMRKARAL